MRMVFEKFTVKHLLMLLDSQYPYQNRSDTVAEINSVK